MDRIDGLKHQIDTPRFQNDREGVEPSLSTKKPDRVMQARPGSFYSSAVWSRRADENREGHHGGSVTTPEHNNLALALSTFSVTASKEASHGKKGSHQY